MKRYCIKCKKEIKPIEPELHSTPEYSGMWENGIVEAISAGYGSRFDGNIYIIAICDDCIKENEDILEYIGDYNFE